MGRYPSTNLIIGWKLDGDILFQPEGEGEMHPSEWDTMFNETELEVMPDGENNKYLGLKLYGEFDPVSFTETFSEEEVSERFVKAHEEFGKTSLDLDLTESEFGLHFIHYYR
jgi:hypothetical protein